MEMLMDYVVLVVAAICLAIGFVIKNSVDFIANKYIPLLMAVLGVVLNIWLNHGNFTPEILLGGLASGLASTGAFELIKNIKKGEGK